MSYVRPGSVNYRNRNELEKDSLNISHYTGCAPNNVTKLKSNNSWTNNHIVIPTYVTDSEKMVVILTFYTTETLVT